MKYIMPGMVLLLFSFSSFAQKPVAPWFVERFKISAGFFAPINNTDIKVERTNSNSGTDIDFENDLGYDRNVGTFMGDLQWRASRRSRFDLSFYRVSRSTTYTLKKDINFGDHTYPVNSTVESFFNTNIVRFSYGYAIFAKPKYEIGALIGVHVVPAEVGLSLMTSSGTSTVSDNYDVTAPLPDFGIWGGYAFNKRFAANGEVGYLGLTIDDKKGRIFAFNILFTYKLLKPLDLSLGYTGLGFRVDATNSNLNGHLKWSYNGPSLRATFSFGNKKWVHE